jgi:hypothetical protein
MPGMSGSSAGMAANMAAVFQTSIATPLYSLSWTPSGRGTYAATCLFLVALAVVFRLLLAAKAVQEGRWLDAELNRRYVTVRGRPSLAQTVSTDSLAKRMTLSENGVEEDVVVLQRRRRPAARPWRLSVDPLRAFMDTVLAGVAYLL